MRFVNLWHFFSFQCFFLEPDLVFRWIDFKLLAFLTLRLQTFSNRHISVSPRYCGGITIILLNSINAENVNENYINEIFEVFKDSGNRYYFSVTLEKILLLLQENPWKNYIIFCNRKFFFFFFFNFSFFFFEPSFKIVKWEDLMVELTIFYVTLFEHWSLKFFSERGCLRRNNLVKYFLHLKQFIHKLQSLTCNPSTNVR